MVSALSSSPARSDTSMTGELTLTGRVLAIGGLKEKTSAAYAAGVSRIIIPKENEADLEEIDPTVRENVNFILVSHAREVLPEIIVSENICESVQKKESPMDLFPITSSASYNSAQI